MSHLASVPVAYRNIKLFLKKGTEYGGIGSKCQNGSDASNKIPNYTLIGIHRRPTESPRVKRIQQSAAVLGTSSSLEGPYTAAEIPKLKV
jgi:hypothetical protein